MRDRQGNLLSDKDVRAAFGSLVDDIGREDAAEVIGISVRTVMRAVEHGRVSQATLDKLFDAWDREAAAQYDYWY